MTESPVVPQVGIKPAYETSMRKCERCPARYLEVKRIDEEGYRLCCGCWWELARETIVYGLDQMTRQGGLPENPTAKEELKNYSSSVASADSIEEHSCYLKQVAANKRQRIP